MTGPATNEAEAPRDDTTDPTYWRGFNDGANATRKAVEIPLREAMRRILTPGAVQAVEDEYVRRTNEIAAGAR